MWFMGELGLSGVRFLEDWDIAMAICFCVSRGAHSQFRWYAVNFGGSMSALDGGILPRRAQSTSFTWDTVSGTLFATALAGVHTLLHAI
jgi:hypothetical protein